MFKITRTRRTEVLVAHSLALPGMDYYLIINVY
jgi:hypothetical protein